MTDVATKTPNTTPEASPIATRNETLQHGMQVALQLFGELAGRIEVGVTSTVFGHLPVSADISFFAKPDADLGDVVAKLGLPDEPTERVTNNGRGHVFGSYDRVEYQGTTIRIYTGVAS